MTKLTSRQIYVSWEYYEHLNDFEEDIIGRVVNIGDDGRISFPSLSSHQISDLATKTISGLKNQSAFNSASVAALGSNRIVAVWDVGAENATDVYARVIDISDSGEATMPSSPFRINTNTFHAQDWPAIIAMSSTVVFITWDSYGQDGLQSAYSIFGQAINIDAQGNPSRIGTEYQINRQQIGQ